MSSRTAVRPRALSAYVIVTGAYWSLMLTDGALRMLVLLHFHTLGFDPLQLAYLFLLYEFLGIVTNLSAGWLAARFGLTSTLYAGLLLQICALVALTQLDPKWSVGDSVVFVMAVQGIAGAAKDLTKMSSKSAVKVLVPEDNHGQLFRWVALLTGSKNAVKGFGFLLGTALLATVGFGPSLWGMAVVLAIVFLACLLAMPSGLPKGRSKVLFRDVFSRSANVNWLCGARLFLFGARDIWFVVGVPIYFYEVLSDGTDQGMRWAFFMVGAFMAVWIIGYGVVQANAPRLLRLRDGDPQRTVRQTRYWALYLAAVPIALAVVVGILSSASVWLTTILVAGLFVFGFLFAINSSLHSFLILAFTRTDRVTMDVGVYYMSNAAGRLIGTLLSGLSYQFYGLPGCLAAAAAFVLCSFALTTKLHTVQ